MKALAGAFLLAVATVGAPAQAAIKDAKPNGFTVENSEWVPVSPQVAYAALVNDVGRWWPADHTWWGDA
ncbi:MAG TPA: SRPBCC domain-containing protein, partial [Pseudoxanthomonas sp.]